jgi:amino acid permease
MNQLFNNPAKVIKSMTQQSSLILISSHSSPAAQEPSQSGQTTTFRKLRKQESLASLIGLFGATFGIGSLGLTAMMARVGVFSWIVLFVLALTVNLVAFNAVIYFTDKHGLKSFVDFGTVIGSPKLKTVITVLFFLVNFGTILSTMAVYNGLLCTLLIKLGVKNPIMVHVESLVWMVVPAMLLLPILVKRKLKDVAFVTVISLVSALYLIIYLLTMFVNSNAIHVGDKFRTISFSAFIPTVFGYLVGSLNCCSNLVNIYNELPVKSVPNMKRLLTINSVFFVIVYSCFGLLGYVIFYDKPNVESAGLLSHLIHSRSMFTLIADCLMIITALNSFVYAFKPVKDTILQLMSNDSNDKDSDFDATNIIVTCSLFATASTLSALLTLSEISFLHITELVNSFLVPPLFIIMPTAAYYKARPGKLVLLVLTISVGFYLWDVKVLLDKIWKYNNNL